MYQKPSDEQLHNRYDKHLLTLEQEQRCMQIRATIMATSRICVDLTPVSPEQTRALNALDEAMMMFIAAIERNEQH